MANHEQRDLHRVIEGLFELAAPCYLKTKLWRVYLVTLSESGQKATSTKLDTSVLEPLDPHVQQVLTSIARTYQSDRNEGKGYESTQRAICEALLEIAVPGPERTGLKTAYESPRCPWCGRQYIETED